jgi:hypothetical protein
MALTLAIEGEADWSERILRQQAQDDPRVAFNLGWHELRHGNLHRGMDLMSAGRILNVFGSPPLATTAPLFRGPNPTILLRSEGGLGDHIVNARFATNLAAYGRVVLATHPSLVALLGTIDGVSEVVADTDALPPHDYWVPAMSAPYVLKLEYPDLSGAPYLRATPRTFPAGFNVGLRWSGNPQFEHEQHRKFDPSLMLALASIPNVTCYSLQRDHDLLDVPFTDLREEMTDWTATASIVAGLDLVITSDTSLAHCAAALGVETWVIVPVLPYYVWALPGDTTPWYDTARVYRQETFGDWAAPFAKIAADVQARVSTQRMMTLTRTTNTQKQRGGDD